MNSFSCLLWRIGEKQAAEPDDAELVSLSKRLVENAVLKAVQQYLEETQNKSRQTDGSPAKTEEAASGSKNESDNDNSKWALCTKPGSKYPTKNDYKTKFRSLCWYLQSGAGVRHSALWVSYRKFVLNWRTLSTGLVSACTAENLSNAVRDGRWKKDKSGEAGGSGLHLLLIPRLPSLLLKRNWTFCICHLDCCGWLWMTPCHKWKRCPAPEALAALQGCLLRVRARAVS